MPVTFVLHKLQKNFRKMYLINNEKLLIHS